MRIEQLSDFLEVNRCQSINQASKNLHISQQSLSKSLHALERELGVTLLDRTVKGISLTANGKIVVEKANTIIAEIKNMREALLPEFVAHHQSISGEVHILHSNAFDRSLMESALKLLHTKYPGITVSLHEQSVADCSLALKRNDSDINLITLTSDEAVNRILLNNNPDHFLVTPLKEAKLLIAVEKTSPLAKQKSISIRTLLNHPLILLDHASDNDISKNWVNILLNLYGKPNFVFKTNNHAMYYQAIAQKTGLGFLIQTNSILAKVATYPDIAVVPIRNGFSVYSCYVLNKHLPLSKATQAFVNILDELKK